MHSFVLNSRQCYYLTLH